MGAKLLDVIFAVLLVIGGLNWALVGIFNFNLVTWLFASSYMIARIVYILVGLAALWQTFQFKKIQERWGNGGGNQQGHQ